MMIMVRFSVVDEELSIWRLGAPPDDLLLQRAAGCPLQALRFG